MKPPQVNSGIGQTAKTFNDRFDLNLFHHQSGYPFSCLGLSTPIRSVKSIPAHHLLRLSWGERKKADGHPRRYLRTATDGDRLNLGSKTDSGFTNIVFH